MKISVTQCTGKYGVENLGRCSFADEGRARRDWLTLVGSTWADKKSHWVTLYIPLAARAWRDDPHLPPLPAQVNVHAAGAGATPPPPKPHPRQKYGFGRWPLGVPAGKLIILDDPLSPKAYLGEEWHAFLAAMQQ